MGVSGPRAGEVSSSRVAYDHAMTPSDLAGSLRDVAFTTTTPFSADGASVLREELEEHVAFLVERGARLLVPCGNSGEYYSLSPDERVAVAEATVEAAGDGCTVVPGVGGSLPAAKDLARRYEEVGADGLLAMYPAHTYVHRRGLIEYYRALADATELGVVLYVRGPEVGNEVLAAVADHERVVGVKYAVNDVESFSAAVSADPGDLVWINGLAERFAPAFAVEGAAGFTTGVGNFAPEAPLSLLEALRGGDWERARAVRDAVRPYEDLRESPGVDNETAAANNVPAVKFGVELAGLYGGPVRPPLVDLAEEDRERARECYERIQESEAIRQPA